MKKLTLPLIIALAFPLIFACNSSRLAGYLLNERDAAAAIRQMLSLGTQDNLANNFTKDRVLSTLFPEDVARALNTLNTLGLTSEVDRFTTTMSAAAAKTATASVPVFVNSINNLSFNDAIRIVKNGGTSATDYLRTSAGDSLRRSIAPIMQSTLNEYKLNEQWEQVTKPVKALVGNKLNVDLSNIMAGLVAEAMFRKIAEKEIQVRRDVSARSTALLQKVFSASFN